MAIINNDVDIQTINYNGTNLTKVIYNGVVVWPEYEQYVWIKPTGNATVSYVLRSGQGPFKDLLYSFDRITWNSLDDIGVSVSANTKLYLKSNTSDAFGRSSGRKGIHCTANYSVGGNINRLFNGSSIPEYALVRFFYNETNLNNVSELYLGTDTANYCYSEMFYGCSNLTKIPALPAMQLSEYCYQGMFYNCTSLVNAPVLPATSLKQGCYQGMFLGCSSLTNAPELPALTAVDTCYYEMFYNCTSLQKAPHLPAKTVAYRCYDGMFKGCSSLITVPALPAKTMEKWCYSRMFQNCTSIKFGLSQVYTNNFRIPTSGTGSEAFTNTYWNEDMFSGTTGTVTANPGLNVTYSTNATVV